MEVSVLVAILSPCLGVLLKGVNAAAEEIGKAVAPELLDHAKRLWAKLRPHVESKPAALEAAGDVAQAPDDARTRAAFELQLEKLLKERPELASELAPIVKDAVASGVVETATQVSYGSVNTLWDISQRWASLSHCTMMSPSLWTWQRQAAPFGMLGSQLSPPKPDQNWFPSMGPEISAPVFLSNTA